MGAGVGSSGVGPGVGSRVGPVVTSCSSSLLVGAGEAAMEDCMENSDKTVP